LLDGGHDREVRVDSRHWVMIRFVDEQGEGGTPWREVLRFDQTEQDNAGRNGISTPMVVRRVPFQRIPLSVIAHG
jgi:hypothetical protein